MQPTQLFTQHGDIACDQIHANVANGCGMPHTLTTGYIESVKQLRETLLIQVILHAAFLAASSAQSWRTWLHAAA